MSSTPAYSILADFYDDILGPYHAYPALGRLIRRLIDRFTPRPAWILELGAGSCPLSRVPAYPPSARVIYSDLSPAMLARAHGRGIPRRVAANALAIPFKGPMDVCVMLIDAINYMLDEKEVRRCLREALGVLRPGGLFILNVASEALCRNELKAVTLAGQAGGYDYCLQTRYDLRTRRLHTRFTFYVDNGNGTWRKDQEDHVQRVYSLKTIRRLAAEAGFKVKGCYSGFGMKPAREGAKMIHFALVRP